MVPPLTEVAGYKHAYMKGLEQEVGKPEFIERPCDEWLTKAPRGVGRGSLHQEPLYIEHAQRYGKEVSIAANLGIRWAHIRDEKEVAREVAKSGWRLVATAFHSGRGTAAGGPQVSHLMQHPGTLHCMITFQGTKSPGDILADLDIREGEFCGLPEKVHRGFRDHLRRIVKTKVWQEKIRPYLPGCSRHLVSGHSLGGAMAELYTACVARAPKPGQEGYDEDYKYMGWTEGKARTLPYVSA